jgi:hypothetical protein
LIFYFGNVLLECTNGTCQNPPDCIPGNPCKVSGKKGPCADGVTTCNGSEVVCTQVVQPATETCDKIDNDCDGSTDEEIAETECQTTLAQCQTGFSVPGTMQCVNGSSVCKEKLCTERDTKTSKCVCTRSTVNPGQNGYPCGEAWGAECNSDTSKGELTLCTPGSQCEYRDVYGKDICEEKCDRFLSCWTPSQLTIGSGC